MSSAVVVSPRVEQRKNLELFFNQLPRLGGLKEATVITEGMLLIQHSSIPDYVFLSDELDKAERERFISWIRERKLGRKTVFITISGADRTNTETLGDHLAAGSHAVLREPITLQSLQDVIAIAKGVKTQGTQLRLKTAAGLFLSSALDKLAMESGAKLEPKDIKVKVSEAIKDFKQITGVSLTLEAMRPVDTGDGSGARLERYKGVSQRVREIYEKRLAPIVTRIFDRPKG